MNYSLIKARTDRGYSQEELARRTGLSKPTSSRLENGVTPRPANAKRIADELGVLIGDIFDFVPDMEAA